MNEHVKKYIENLRSRGPVWFAETYWKLATGELVILRPMQRVFLNAVFEHLYDTTTFCLLAMKKLGKTFTNAIFVLWKMLAFPGCEVLLHANSQSQSVLLVFSEIVKMIQQDPFLAGECNITQREIVFRPTGSKITCLAVSGAANAGSNHNLLSSSETWGIESDLEVENWQELQPGPLDILGCPAQTFIDSYYGYAGKAESLHKLVEHGLTLDCINEEWQIYKGGGVLLMCLSGEEMLRKVWHKSEVELDNWIAKNFREKSDGRARRHLFNELVSGESMFPEDLWRMQIHSDHRPLAATKEVLLVGGIDLAWQKSGDDIAISFWYSDGPFVKLALHKLLKGRGRKEEQKLQDIEDYLYSIFSAYQVSQINYDKYEMIGMAQRLQSKGVLMERVSQSTQSMILRATKVYQGMREQKLMIYPHDDWINAHAGIQIVDQPKSGVLFKRAGKTRVDLMTSLVIAVPDLLDLSEPIDPALLEQAHIELTEPSLWRTGADRGWVTGRAGYKSRFRNPGRR